MAEELSPRAFPGGPGEAAAAGAHPGLPARDYFDPGVYELEKERIFFRRWFCIGRESELPEAGAFLAREVADESVLLVRGRDLRLRAFYNVCRHRGSRLCEEPAGRVAGGFVCPYHGWSYSLEGRLLATPHVGPEARLDRGSLGLSRVAAENRMNVTQARSVSMAWMGDGRRRKIQALHPVWSRVSS